MTFVGRGKYNLILDVQFDNGQFCLFAKLFSIEKENKLELFTESLEKDVNLWNGLNLNYKSKKRIEKFMESMNYPDAERSRYQNNVN